MPRRWDEERASRPQRQEMPTTFLTSKQCVNESSSTAEAPSAMRGIAAAKSTVSRRLRGDSEKLPER